MESAELLAMSRYLAFVATILALIRSARDAWVSVRNEQHRVGRIIRRQLRNIWLIGICFYYIRALYVPGYAIPDSGDLALINLFYAGYFLSTTIPRFRRKTDRVPLPDAASARGS